jgi:serine/threonine protein phosphatase 1
MIRYCIGDIHGRAKALKEVLDFCRFDYDEDQLIILGDVADGGDHTRQVINILLKAKNRILITGNHDQWLLQWFKTGSEPPIWTTQGGRAAMYSYDYRYRMVPKSHVAFLESSVDYYVDDKKNIFVHGGFDPEKSIECQELPYRSSRDVMMWDREIIEWALTHGAIPGYNHVFIGHTSTAVMQRDRFTPMVIDNLILLDTGAGYIHGRLTIMDIDTMKYWQVNVTE